MKWLKRLFRNSSGRQTALFDAASKGSPETIRALLAAGADVKAKDKYGRTAVFYAALKDRPEAVLALIAQGADVEAKDKYGMTALHYAASRRSPKTFQALSLLAQGADRDRDGRTALQCAVLKDRPEIARALLAAGADAEAKDQDGRTALHYAVLGYVRDTCKNRS